MKNYKLKTFNYSAITKEELFKMLEETQEELIEQKETSIKLAKKLIAANDEVSKLKKTGFKF